MAKKSRLQIVTADQPVAALESVLPGQDCLLFREMLEAYRMRRLGALRHHLKSVNRDVSVITEFLYFTGRAPWYWTEGDFEKWCFEVGVNRHLAVSSQRHYQGVIRGF